MKNIPTRITTKFVQQTLGLEILVHKNEFKKILYVFIIYRDIE